MNPLRKLTSALSTAHALVLSAIELPDALKYVVEFARENGATKEEISFWKAARDRWVDWACHVDGGQRTPGTDDYDGDSDMMARITKALRENSELRKALNLAEEYRENQTTTCSERHNRIKALEAELNTLQSRLTETEKMLGGMNLLYDEQCRSTIDARKNGEELAASVMRECDALRNRILGQECRIREVEEALGRVRAKRDALRAKLDDLERWRQVTSGEGELPPEGVDVIYRYDDRPRLFLGKPSNNRTYQWRFVSSGEASNG